MQNQLLGHMNYIQVQELYRAGNITAAKAALVEALKKGALAVFEKKSVIRLNSEPLLEAYTALMPPDPKEWEVQEIIRTGNLKIIGQLDVPAFSVAAQKALLDLGCMTVFEQQFRRHPEIGFCSEVNRFIIASGNNEFAAAYLRSVWLDREEEEFLLAGNDIDLIRLYFRKYDVYAEMVERLGDY